MPSGLVMGRFSDGKCAGRGYPNIKFSLFYQGLSGLCLSDGRVQRLGTNTVLGWERKIPYRLRPAFAILAAVYRSEASIPLRLTTTSIGAPVAWSI